MDVSESIKAAQAFGAEDHKLFIDGHFVDGQGGERITSINPSTGKAWASVEAATADDVDRAAQAAQRCFEEVWSKAPPRTREKLLRRFATLVERHGDIICALDACDSGRLFSSAAKDPATRPIGTASIQTLLDTIHYFAGWPTKIAGQSFPSMAQPDGSSMRSMRSLREPVGVVACILPWNAPALFMINKAIPALAAGCTVVVKPAEQTPVSALYLASLFREAGFPDGAVNVVNGWGATAGAALSAHPLVKKITFTGSTQVGRRISAAASTTFKRLTLELGGKSAFIVMDDADLDAAALAARSAGYGNAGQFCMCPSRLFVEESVYDAFIDRVQKLARDIVVGGALSPATTMGPVITRKDRDRIAGMVDEARGQGVDIVFGGKALDGDGHFYQPTLLRHENTDVAIARDEVFGPVLLAVPFKKAALDDLVARANETDFGLAASVWTRDLSIATKMTERLQAGIVTVNMHPGIDPMIAFGGIKASGIGREFGAEGFESFFETKSVHIFVSHDGYL